ncbi:DUF6308 family protein [Streptomyces hyaluromycini]|uniref:DUF6308 family protein n=1 Tax=Streptomyces hyaluromycini TaxID=1377993 RepID=A0ABV1X0R7_9ACTN
MALRKLISRSSSPRKELGVDIDMVEAADLADGSPAHTAWHLLRDRPGIGWVTAGELLARKRDAVGACSRPGRPMRPLPPRVVLARPACRAGHVRDCGSRFDAAVGVII